MKETNEIPPLSAMASSAEASPAGDDPRSIQLMKLLFELPTPLLIGMGDGRWCRMSAPAVALLGSAATTSSPGEGQDCVPDDVEIEANGECIALAAWIEAAIATGARSRQLPARLTRPALPPLDVLVSFSAVGEDSDADGRAVWALAIEDLSAGRIISQQAETAARQQAAIANLGLRALTEPELPHLLNRLCSVARQLLDVDRVAYWEFWQEALPVARLVAGDGWERDVVGKLEVSLDMDTPLARVLTSRRPIVIRDDGRQAAAWHLEGGRPIHASLVTPVTDDSRVTGALCILHGANRGYTEDDVNFVTALSTVIASAEARRRYERELIARTEALARAEDEVRTERAERLIELGAVAGAVAHQVNNAVNSIQMNADLALLLLERAAEDATVRESLERIRADCGRCAAVVREVLALSRSEAPAPAESLPLAACLDEAVGILRRGAGPAPELRRHRSVGMATVFGRRLELGLAFANLARTRGEAGASWVQVTAAAREDRLRVEMVDNGPPPEHAGLPGLFDNLVPGRVATGGLGLGLAHRIISDHSGNIAADAPESGGCRFIIELPATATAA